ncbi:MAG: imidazolonepropionase-like domain-containing protein, partial [Acidimicrobiales bacterium]
MTSVPSERPEPGGPPADAAIFDAAVFTADRSVAAPQAIAGPQAVAIRNGRIIAVGTDDEVRRHCGMATQVIDASGRSVIPGV